MEHQRQVSDEGGEFMASTPIATPISGPLFPGVNHSHRSSWISKERKLDLYLGIMFLVNLTISILIGSASIYTGKSLDAFNEMNMELEKCQSERGSGRYLSEEERKSRFWKLFNLKTLGIAALIIGIIYFVWLRMITRFPVKFVWSMIILPIAAMYILCLVLISQSRSADTLISLLFPIIMTLFIMVMRDKITKSATHLQFAASTVLHNPYMVFTSIVVQIPATLYGCFALAALISVAFHLELDQEQCELTLPNPGRFYFLLMHQTFMLYWSFHFWAGVQNVAVSIMTATRFFHELESDLVYRAKSFAPLRTALSTSFGTIAAASFIVSVVEVLRSMANRKNRQRDGGILQILFCVISCIMSMLEEFIRIFTRYALVAHALSGEGLYNAGSQAYLTLRNNFVGAYINDWVAQRTVSLSVSIISSIIGIGFWVALTEHGIFPEEAWVLVLALFFATFIPTFGMLIVLGIAISNPNVAVIYVPAMIGTFVASLSSLCLSFASSVMFDSMHASFLCASVAMDNQCILAEEVKDFVEVVKSLPEAKVIQEHQGLQV